MTASSPSLTDRMIGTHGYRVSSRHAMVVPHIACLSVRRQAIGRVRCRRKTAADRLRLQLYCLGAEELTAIARWPQEYPYAVFASLLHLIVCMLPSVAYNASQQRMFRGNRDLLSSVRHGGNLPCRGSNRRCFFASKAQSIEQYGFGGWSR